MREQKIYKMKLQSVIVSHIKKIQNKRKIVYARERVMEVTNLKSSQWPKKKQIEPSKETSIEI